MMNNELPLVSVLMTSFNSEKFIAEAIRSIINQTYANWELLIADDCSADSTREVIASFDDERIRVYHNSVNQHYLRTRNRLANKIKGDFITLLDSDDLCTPDRLEKQLKAFKDDPELGLCGCFVRYIDVAGKELDIPYEKPTEYNEIRKKIKNENVFTGSTILVKKSIWIDIGGYRDFFNSLGYEDYDLTSRIVEKYKCINIPDKLYIYRQYPESSSKSNLLFNPFKLHGYALIQKFIAERSGDGVDSLEKGDIPGIINFVMEKHKPYVEDPSYIYRVFMWSHLNRKMFWLAFSYSMKAIQIKPLKFINHKTLVLFFLIYLGIIKN
ncbi:MAG: glycosyltransferase [Cytophagales bacterium]|nr:glycosyltransferase [Cytophagales bacterium]